MTNLEKAKSLLKDNLTCVLVSNENVLTFTDMGVAPIMKIIESKTDISGYSACDKVIGKAAAMLFVLAGVREVHAKTISKTGLETLKEHNIKITYDTLVEKITNRAGTGICPMEETVLMVEDPKEAYVKLKEKIAQMKANKMH